MMDRGQLSTEYLVIIAIVIVIALVVVAIQGYFMEGSAQSINPKPYIDYWRTQRDVGLMDWKVDEAGGIAVAVRNHVSETIQITSILVDGQELLSQSLSLMTGMRETICGQTTLGKGTYFKDVIITYTNVRYGTTFTVKGEKPIMGNYMTSTVNCAVAADPTCVDGCIAAGYTGGSCDATCVKPGGKADLVFIIDRSGSMGSIWTVVCTTISNIATDLAADGIDVVYEVNGLQSGYSCGTAFNGCIYGGVPIPCHNEHWGPGTTGECTNHVFRPATTKIVIPISDEGPYAGTPVNSADTTSIAEAISACTANNVLACPIYRGPIAQAQAQTLAAGTGGVAMPWGGSFSDDLKTLIKSVVKPELPGSFCGGTDVCCCDV